MPEYISKEDTIRKIAALQDKATTGLEDVVYYRAMKTIRDMPAVEAPAVDDWISVRERLPETNAIGVAHVLVYDTHDGVVKADFLDESANYINGSNIFQISNTSTQLRRVTHWKPLPEQPKYGEKE